MPIPSGRTIAVESLAELIRGLRQGAEQRAREKQEILNWQVRMEQRRMMQESFEWQKEQAKEQREWQKERHREEMEERKLAGAEARMASEEQRKLAREQFEWAKGEKEREKAKAKEKGVSRKEVVAEAARAAGLTKRAEGGTDLEVKQAARDARLRAMGETKGMDEFELGEYRAALPALLAPRKVEEAEEALLGPEALPGERRVWLGGIGRELAREWTSGRELAARREPPSFAELRELPLLGRIAAGAEAGRGLGEIFAGLAGRIGRGRRIAAEAPRLTAALPESEARKALPQFRAKEAITGALRSPARAVERALMRIGPPLTGQEAPPLRPGETPEARMAELQALLRTME